MWPRRRSTVIISQAEQGHFGEYRCSVENDIGTSHSTVTLVEKGEPEARIIGSGIRIKLGIWRDNLGDRHLASSLVAGDPGELGELTLSATQTQTQTREFGKFGL